MFFLLSGEGPTDIGVCRGGREACDAGDFDHGPMTILVDHIVQGVREFSLIDESRFEAVSKARLTEVAGELKSPRNRPRLPGAKRPKETLYFYQNARAMARLASKSEAERRCEVVAILFRDADGTVSAGRGLWQDKWNSMLAGFREEGFARGVPMIPRPKSEAWILCGLQNLNARGCEALEENASGNDRSPNALKNQLETLCNGRPTREDLCAMIHARQVNASTLSSPSFAAFRDRLIDVIRVDR